MKAAVSILLEAAEPFVGYLPGDAEMLRQLGYGGSVQLVIFEESLSLFRQDNTFPGHGLQLFHRESVADILIIFRNLCLGLIQGTRARLNGEVR